LNATGGCVHVGEKYAHDRSFCQVRTARYRLLFDM
jgi:hypothetical protein